MFVVLGTFPTMETTITVGPFKTEKTAAAADYHMTGLGWNTEVCELMSLDDVPDIDDYQDGD